MASSQLSQFSLLWDGHQRNICAGLSSLQQNGEFVDMTIAADGRFVKVHQIVLALASPYLKEMINSANCSHPVIFLNKVSGPSLCNILEYIYTGEVSVPIENFNDFIEAGKNLHIKGLEDMTKVPEYTQLSTSNNTIEPDEIPSRNMYETLRVPSSIDDDDSVDNTPTIFENQNIISVQTDKSQGNSQEKKANDIKKLKKGFGTLQYTVSNQGSLQIILNRFMYYLKHTSKSNQRQWRCVDYMNNSRCPAYVITKGDVVVERISAHTHPYHDKRILKKYKLNSIYSAIDEAEKEGYVKKQNKSSINISLPNISE